MNIMKMWLILIVLAILPTLVNSQPKVIVGRQVLCSGELITPADARYYEHRNRNSGKFYDNPDNQVNAIATFDCELLIYHTLESKGMFGGGLQVLIKRPVFALTMTGENVKVVNKQMRGDDWEIKMREGVEEHMPLGRVYIGYQQVEVELSFKIRAVTSTLGGSWVTTDYEVTAIGN